MGFVLETAPVAVSQMRNLGGGILRPVFFQPGPDPEKPSKNPVFRLPFHLAAEPENKKTLGPLYLKQLFSGGADSMPIEIKPFVTGPIETNTYVVWNEKKQCCVVDPSGGCKAVLKFIEDQSLVPGAIILTHGHFDHCIGIPEILAGFPEIPVWVHPQDADFLKRADYNGSFMVGLDFAYTGPLNYLTEGKMRIGGMECTVFHVPGHTPGGCALVFENHCLSGDSLFAGSVGRSDWEYGDGDLLIRAIKEKLVPLPEATVVHPGHMGRTTIGREKRMNPFLQE